MNDRNGATLKIMESWITENSEIIFTGVVSLLSALVGASAAVVAQVVSQRIQWSKELKIRKEERAIEIVKILHRNTFVVINGIHELSAIVLSGKDLDPKLNNMIREAQANVAEARGVVAIFFDDCYEKLSEMYHHLGSLSDEIRNQVIQNSAVNLEECPSWQSFANLLDEVTQQLKAYAQR